MFHGNTYNIHPWPRNSGKDCRNFTHLAERLELLQSESLSDTSIRADRTPHREPL